MLTKLHTTSSLFNAFYFHLTHMLFLSKALYLLPIPEEGMGKRLASNTTVQMRRVYRYQERNETIPVWQA